MKKYFALLVLGTLLISCNQKTKSTDHPLAETATAKDSLTMALNTLHEIGQINGFAVAVVNEDKTLYTKGIGFADKKAGIEYNEHTVQNIASISKTLIGIALLKAQEMGQLKLQDPINDYLPFEVRNPNFPSEPITINQLATHTSSIIDSDVYDEQSYIMSGDQGGASLESLEVPDYFNSPEMMISMSEFMKNTLVEDGKWYTEESFLNKKPGEFFEYSNVAATLAALVLEYATGQSYSDYTKIHILQPLSMDASGWSLNEIDPLAHTKLYANPSDQLPFYSLITYPDGGFITSSNDLSKYLVELIKGYAGTGTLLSQESYKQLFTMQLEDRHFEERNADHPYNDEYNMGVFMGFSAKGYVGHTGGDPGVSSLMFFDSEKKIGRLLLINTDLDNEEGMQEFISIWETLGEYQDKLE